MNGRNRGLMIRKKGGSCGKVAGKRISKMRELTPLG
jgi:hypothetical protein